MTTPEPWLTALSNTIRAINAEVHPGLRWKIGAGAELRADLNLDTLSHQSIACALDEQCGIEIPDAAIDGWTFVSDVARTVVQLTQAKEGAAA
jgi:acyl carrier protein